MSGTAVLLSILVGCQLHEALSDDLCFEKLISNEFYDDIIVITYRNCQDILVPKNVVYLFDFDQFSSTEDANVLLYATEIDDQLIAELVGKGLNKYMIVTADYSNSIPILFKQTFVKDLVDIVVVIRRPTFLSVYYRKSFDSNYEYLENYCENNVELYVNQYKFNWNYLEVAHIHFPPFVIDVKRKERPGLSVSLLNTMSEKAKLNISYTNRSVIYNHEFRTNGSFYQLYKDLIVKKVDVAIGHLLMNATSVTPFHFGPVLYNDIIRTYTPRRKKLQIYRKLVNVFEKTTWRRYVITLSIAILIYYILVKILNENIHFLDVVFGLIGLTFGAGAYVLPKFSSIRILFVAFCLFTLNMDSIYLGKLSSSFSLPTYDDGYNTLAHIVQKRVEFNASWYSERLLLLVFVLSRGDLSPYNTITTTPDYELFRRTAYARSSTVSFDSIKKAYPTEAQLVDYFVPVNLFLTLFVTIYISKKSMYAQGIQFWSREIVEKGFTIKWFNDISLHNINTSLLPRKEEEKIVLKLAHFEELFIVLAYGYLLAILTLLLEFCYNYIDGKLHVTDFYYFLCGLLKPPKKVWKSAKPKN